MKTPKKIISKVVRGNVLLRDVAAECGVSVATASIVLNRSPLAQNLSAATRSRVEDAARKLKYTPNLMARSLRNRQSQTIGMVIFDIADPYCTRLLKGIESAIETTQFLPLIMSVQNKTGLFRRYSRLAQERRVEGLILVPNSATMDWSVFDSVPSISCVTIGYKPPADNYSCILVDNVGGGFRAMEHLYQLGHRNIAILRGPEHNADSLERWKGIQKFARQVRLAIDPALVKKIQIQFEANSAFREGHRLTVELIERGRPFTALVAYDDLTAAGAIRAFHEAGWNIPRRCSIIGFDDIPNAELMSPALTTMRQPLEDMGKLAVEMLLAGIEKKNPTAHGLAKVFDPTLIERASTGHLL